MTQVRTKKLVLVIEDDLSSATFVSMILKRSGFDTESAGSAGSGIAKAVNLQPDLILLDAMLIDMDGWESCKMLKAMPETKHIPVIIFSNKTEYHITLGLSAGADDYIVKPVDSQELLQRVSKTIAHIEGYVAETGKSNPFTDISEDMQKKLLNPMKEFDNTNKSQIFISYRRSDSEDVTGRLYDQLCASFGKECIYRDVHSIPIGVDFRDHLRKNLEECRVLLAIIGRNWLTQINEQGRNRLEDPNDFVRLEIETALDRGITVIPVLVQNSVMPTSDQLPETMRLLAFRNAANIKPDPYFHYDLQKLINHLGHLLDTEGY